MSIDEVTVFPVEINVFSFSLKNTIISKSQKRIFTLCLYLQVCDDLHEISAEGNQECQFTKRRDQMKLYVSLNQSIVIDENEIKDDKLNNQTKVNTHLKL